MNHAATKKIKSVYDTIEHYMFFLIIYNRRRYSLQGQTPTGSFAEIRNEADDNVKYNHKRMTS